MNVTFKQILFLIGLVLVLYLFSPEVSLFKSQPVSDQQVTKELPLDIKGRSLADPRQGDLRLKEGRKVIVLVTTDEDGRLDLVSTTRDTFNPIFSGTTNSISIPTDKKSSYRIVIHPGTTPTELTPGIVIGTIVVD
jgi:hypothetical protein